MKELRKVIVVPDSFKGGMTSQRFCDIARSAVHRIFPAAQVVVLPVADGGEGTVDAFLAAVGGEKIKAVVNNPFFEETESFYGRLPDGTAVVEMAACAGLTLAAGRENPLVTTTYGVGQLIRQAILDGCGRVILAMGGSATNDAGCGMAAALGVRFLDDRGRDFIPVGGTLGDIRRIETGGRNLGVPVTAMVDIDNPLFGASGAACVFAPQKGADAADVRLLDDGLRHFARIVKSELGTDVETLRGGGAAGGLGAGAVCFLGARLEMGIDVVLDAARFDCQLQDADLVITGEGKIDAQSLRGKTVIGVAKRAKAMRVPAVAIVGDIGDPVDAAYALGLAGIFSINRAAVPLEEAVRRSETDLSLTVENLMRFMSVLNV